MTEQALVGTAEAAKMLGRSPRYIQRLAEKGKLPVAVKMPGQSGAYLFDRALVATLAQKGEAG